MHKANKKLNYYYILDQQLSNETLLSFGSGVDKVSGTTIDEKLVELKEKILKKMKKMKALNEKMNQELVPNVVIANLTQIIKDTEV